MSFSILKKKKGIIEKESEYTFNPEELQELVTKRPGYTAFSVSLNLMKKSESLLEKDVENTPKKSPRKRLRRKKLNY